MTLEKAWNRWRAAFTRELPKAEPASQQTTSRPLKADAPLPASGSGQPQPDIAPPAPEPDQTPALGASALLDAWKARESALTNPPPDPTKPDSSPFPDRPGPPKPGAPVPGPVASDPKRPAAFAPWFVVIAAAIGLGGWLLLNTQPADQPRSEQPNAARPEPVQAASVPLVMCPSESVVPAAGDKDGQFPMQADVSGLLAVDIASFVVLSQEASAAGRERDAEVGLLMSCRIADKLKGAASVESADAKYRLGLHYANLSGREGPAAARNRAELLARAQILLADSLLTYSTRFGGNDDRSRLAASRLASVRQTLAQKPQLQSAPPLSPVPPVSPDGNGFAEAEKLPTPSRSGIAAGPPASPAPAIEAGGKTRRTPPVIKECPPAVATLGLCD